MCPRERDGAHARRRTTMTTKNEALAKKIAWTTEAIAEEKRALAEMVDALVRHATHEAARVAAGDRTPTMSFVQSDVNQIAAYQTKIERLEAVLEALRWVDQFDANGKDSAK